MIRYGKETETDRLDEDTQQITRKTFVNWNEVDRHVTYVEQVAVTDHKDVLTELIKLQNRQKAGEVYNIGIQTIEHPKGTLKFVRLVYEIDPNAT